MFKVPEEYRLTDEKHMFSSDKSYGNNGLFVVPLKSCVQPPRKLNIIASDGNGWDHVSVTIKNDKRCPTWEEMCYVKSLFWDEEDCVVQFHPPKSEYINNHNYCLHLWRNQKEEIKIPPSLMVGI